MSDPAIDPELLTAEEYGRLPNNGRSTELVRGRVVEMSRPFTSHGYYIMRVGSILNQFIQEHDLGRVVGGDAGVVTTRDPDSVRGPDVAFYSFQRLPKGPLPGGYWPVTPDLVFEIRAESDPWEEVVQKVTEFLNAGVLTVAVIDPAARRVHAFSVDREASVLEGQQILSFPEVLPGFEIAVSKLFE